MMNKSLRARILTTVGLLLLPLPFLFKEYIPLPDFFRGLLAGVGLALEITGLILMNKDGIGTCRRSSANTEIKSI